MAVYCISKDSSVKVIYNNISEIFLPAEMLKV